MKFEVLLSCMHAADMAIVQKSNLDQVNTLIINQCETEEDYFVCDNGHRMLHSASRGLSVSRNLALQHANAEICLLSDDDEVFHAGLEERVLRAYEHCPDADVIIFKISNYPKALGTKCRRLGKYELLRVSSIQISFKRMSIVGKVWFDRKLGAGTKNGAGEETKFLLDCHRMGLKVYYYPEEIAVLEQGSSTWFSGYNQQFFFNRGKTSRYIFGAYIATLYAVYYLFLKYRLYKNDISFWQAWKALFKGIMAESIDAKYE